MTTDLIAAIDRRLKKWPSWVVSDTDRLSLSEGRALLEFVKYSLEREQCRFCQDFGCTQCNTERQRHIKALRERFGV